LARGTIHDLVIHDTCGNVADGAEYGINVFNSGQVEVSDNQTTGGFSDAGIYIGGDSTASLQVAARLKGRPPPPSNRGGRAKGPRVVI
jgi:hypothetical protein